MKTILFLLAVCLCITSKAQDIWATSHGRQMDVYIIDSVKVKIKNGNHYETGYAYYQKINPNSEVVRQIKADAAMRKQAAPDYANVKHLIRLRTASKDYPLNTEYKQ